MDPFPSPGAQYLGDGRCLFRVWATKHAQVFLRLSSGREQVVAMEAKPYGYHEALVADAPPGTLYTYRLGPVDGRLGAVELPDPASRHQPRGVHQASAVTDPHFAWMDDDWRGLPLEDYVLYEMHVGTFTERGTFESAIAQLDELRDLGVTALELMPVAQFPGSRNWGYDEVYSYAPQDSYGGPEGLKRLVNACHERGMAVVLDVVYNHVGPEGNYVSEFGPYFTEKYRTPWGQAMNFDGPECDPVRWHFIHNALY